MHIYRVVKEEYTDDASLLPIFNGKVECYLVQSQGSVVGSNLEDDDDDDDGSPTVVAGGDGAGGGGSVTAGSGGSSSISATLPPPGLERGPGVGETRPPSFQ